MTFIYLKRITSLLKGICYRSIKSIATWEIIPVFIKYLRKLILDIIFVVNVSNFKEVLCTLCTINIILNVERFL